MSRLRQPVVWFVVVAGMVCLSSKALCDHTRKHYISPDRKFSAIVVATTNSNHGKVGHDRVEIRRTRGKRLFSMTYPSSDSEHGWVVTRAAWTRDSQFFVWSCESLGGHMPMQNPTWFWSRRLDKAVSLEHLLGHVVALSDSGASFKLSGDHTITVTLWVDTEQKNGPYKHEEPTKRYSLVELEKAYLRQKEK